MLKFIKNIILLWLVVIIIYLLIIFISPNLASSLWKSLWLTSFNQKVLEFKKSLDDWTFFAPIKNSVDWVIDKSWNGVLKNTFSWELKDGFVWWLDSTKEKIDNVRTTISWAENTYKDVKTKYEKTKEIVNDVNDAVNILTK